MMTDQFVAAFGENMLTRIIICGGIVLLSATAYASGISYQGEVSVATNDNINNAWREKDVRKDTSLMARFGAGKAYVLSDNSGFLVSGGLQTEAHRAFDKINFLAARAAVAYRTRPGVHFSSPEYTVELSAREKLSASSIRDSTTFDLKFELFTRVTELTSVLAGAAYSVEEAEGDVFDQSRARIYANVDLLLSPRSTLFITYLFVSGDVVSVGTPDSLSLVLAADALEPDDAFGDGTVTGALAYRLNADTHIVNLGYNLAMNHNSSVDASLRWLSSSAAQNIDYDSLTFRVSYLFQFE